MKWYIIDVHDKRDEKLNLKLNDKTSDFEIVDHSIEDSTELQEQGELLEALCTRSHDLISHIKEETHVSEADQPIILVGRGLAALVTMNAVLGGHNNKAALVPLGIILSSVQSNSPIFSSGSFKTWYRELIEKGKSLTEERRNRKANAAGRAKLDDDASEEDSSDEDFFDGISSDEESSKEIQSDNATTNGIPAHEVSPHEVFSREVHCNGAPSNQVDIKKRKKNASEKAPPDSELAKLKSLFTRFNSHCRRERIRYTYVLERRKPREAKSVQHIFISRLLRYGRAYEDHGDPFWKNLLLDHFNRSWPEKLLHYVKTNNSAKDQLIRDHRGLHYHEPVIARVLMEAAQKGDAEVVEDLLRDGVHPDVRMKPGDETAYDATSDDALNHDAFGIRKLLYRYGAKVHLEADDCPSTYWSGIDGKSNREDQYKELPPRSKMGKQHFRGLIVDIYTKRTPKDDDSPKYEDRPKDKDHPSVDEQIMNTFALRIRQFRT